MTMFDTKPDTDPTLREGQIDEAQLWEPDPQLVTMAALREAMPKYLRTNLDGMLPSDLIGYDLEEWGSLTFDRERIQPDEL